MHTGLMMTSGVDIWLNNPIRPMEASGTSGMKAAMNGVPNCSILDGWWPEACLHGVNGWAIGNAEDDRNDDRDAENIYNVLQHDVIPLWEQEDDGWAEMMKASIVASAGFTGQRMIQDYLEFYSQFSCSFKLTSNDSSSCNPLFLPDKPRMRATTMIPPINNVRVSVIADDLESDVSVVSHGAQATTGHGSSIPTSNSSPQHPSHVFISSVTDCSAVVFVV